MDYFPVHRTMEDDSNSLLDVSVTDVYDQAAGIGKEFEKLIEAYGVDSVTDLMPRVIRALEQLEALASKYEKESCEISDLHYAIDKLESEKAGKVQERARFEEELIQIEESWQKESREQLTTIARLQEDNRRLRESLSEQKQTVNEVKAAVTKETEEKEIEVLTKLKETVDKQREELRKVKREIQQKNVDVEALQTQSERLVKINIELRRKNSSHRKHARTLISEKVDLETQLAEKESQIHHVKELMKEESLDDGHMDKLRLSFSETEGKPGPNGEATDVTATNTILSEGGVQTEEESPENMMQKLSLIGKIIIDKNDPDRPRFTLNELKKVLMERNELKAQLLEVEEELDTYRPRLPLHEYDIIEEEERPVQGPINKEPEYKLNPDKRPSGIRKFFSSLFSSDSPPQQRRDRNRSRNNSRLE